MDDSGSAAPPDEREAASSKGPSADKSKPGKAAPGSRKSPDSNGKAVPPEARLAIQPAPEDEAGQTGDGSSLRSEAERRGGGQGTNRLAQGARRYLAAQGEEAGVAGKTETGQPVKKADAPKAATAKEAAAKGTSKATAGGPKIEPKAPAAAAARAVPPKAQASVSGGAAANAPGEAPGGQAGAAPADQPGETAPAPGGARNLQAEVAAAAPALVPAGQESANLPERVPEEDSLARCLSFLTKIFGHAYSVSELRAGIALDQGVLNIDGLMEAASRIGFEAKAERTSLSKIPRLALPAILMLKDGRACALVRFSGRGKAEIYDPRAGEGTSFVRLGEIESLYAGEAIYIRPQFRFDSRSDVLAVETPKSWFWGTLLQNWWIYGYAILATVIVNLLAIASPIFIMTVYDRVVPNNAIETLWVLAFGIAGVAVFDFCLRTLRAYLVDTAGKRIDVNLGSQLFDHVVRLRMDARGASAGSLASIMREFDFLREFLSSATVTALGDLPFIFLFIFVIWVIGGPIAYVPMVAVPVVLLVAILIQIPLHKVSRASMRESTQKNAHLFEVLHGIETVKSIRAEAWAQRNWEQLVGLTATSSTKMKMLSQIGTHVTMTAQLLVTVGIVVVGVYVLKEGHITQGAMIACVLLSSRVMAPLAQVAGVLVRYEQTKTAFGALHEIMKAPTERMPGKKLVHRPFLKGDVEMKEVSFTYPSQDTGALHRVSFKVKAGEHVAIIGRVGSGKSTILKLVQNLYEPVEGFVRVDDLDTRQIELSDLRRQVGYTPQETVLFHGTIRDNLVQGAPHATDEQVLAAAHLTGLDDMIKGSPKGLDQEVGEHGTLLSGGQRQMIVLARALVLDPPILLMDEPTSHMDNYSERHFIARMKEWLKGRTLLLVTHRATLLSLVDRVIVMDKGQIVADGPKEEVLNALAAGKIGTAQT